MTTYVFRKRYLKWRGHLNSYRSAQRNASKSKVLAGDLGSGSKASKDILIAKSSRSRREGLLSSDNGEIERITWVKAKGDDES